MVVSGEDKGGISKAVKWENGGGYRFYELAPTLINKDEFGEYIINPDYSADMLAAAMALHEGFTYEPDSSAFGSSPTATRSPISLSLPVT